MDQTFESPSKAERDWLASRHAGAAEFVKAFPNADDTRRLSPATLDAAYAAWVASGETETEIVNGVISCVGVAFGEMLVEGLGL